MNASRFVKAVLFPLTETSVLVALITFWLLVLLVSKAGFLGIWLAVLVVPAVFRYQLLLLEAQARGKGPQPPGPEFFNWTRGAWTLFPVVIAVAIGWVAYAAYSSAGTVAMLVLLGICGCIYPSVLAVLAITHSPLQSVSPVALYRFIHEAGPSYLLAPLYLSIIAVLTLVIRDLPLAFSSFVEMFFVFSLHSVIGSITESKGIVDDVYIPDALEPDAKEISSAIEKHRIAVLGHAYGFISRDNREGGLNHIIGEIGEDPDPVGAWAWYFDRMLGWEDQNHALFFAQHYVHDSLRHGEEIAAVKTMLRSRIVDERFRPFSQDVPHAIEAAERTGNTELAAVLRRP